MRRLNGYYFDKLGNQVEFDINIASAWEDLQPKQFATALQLLTFQKADKFVMAVSFLALLFDKNYPILANIDPEQRHALMPLTNFFVETIPPAVNKFPTLKIKRKTRHAAAQDLSNISFGEWCFIYQLYVNYQVTGNQTSLNKLIAILYRPADPGQSEDRPDFRGDLREPFNENLIEKRSRSVADLQESIKLAVIAWFGAALLPVMSQRPHVFPVTPEGHEQTKSDTSSDGRTWLTVFRELLGPKWGTTEQLKHTNAMFVLDALEEQQIEFNLAKANL